MTRLAVCKTKPDDPSDTGRWPPKFSEWAKDASSPFVRTDYRRVAEEYRLRARAN
jgi:hypothetical protein